ncbi:MAG: U32 family peptidase [Litorilituus sp.]|nr:U32 family peptidase [Litorilituus sp.]
MKITAPISRVEEIQLLSDAGADEFYCSVVPESWTAQFQTSAVSRRAFGNLPSFDDLARAIVVAHRLGKKLHLVMNSQHYTGEQLTCLLELATVFDSLEGDAVIVGDETLLALLGSHSFNFAIHASSIASCRNSEAAKFHHELGADRIIFPRNMKISEMEKMAIECPELEFESFVLNDGCVFEEGSCHTIHLPGKLGGAICLDNYQSIEQRVDGESLTQEEQLAFRLNDKQYQSWVWYRFGNGFSMSKNGLLYGPCGLCAVPRLASAGVTSVKIAGRDAPTARKIKSVEMVAQVRQTLMKSGSDRAKILARNMREQPKHCQVGYMCYYPEVRMKVSEKSIEQSKSAIAILNI